MDLKRELPIPEIELSAAHNESEPGDAVLRVSPDTRHLAAGGEASLIQFILTWAGSRSPAQLKFRKIGQAEAQNEHVKLIERVFGLVASILADEYVDGNGAVLDRATITAQALQRLGLLYGPDPGASTKGPAWATLCADSINRSAPYVLYRGQSAGDQSLRTREEYGSVVDSIVRNTFPAARNFLDRDDGTAISAMLYEIFRNTEDHALHNIDGSRVRKSVRGILAQQHAMSPAKLAELAGSYEPLSTYCSQLSTRHGGVPPRDLQQARLLEISTFDAGPGFAESFRKRSRALMTMDEELSAVQECFLKNATSKGRPGFGQGLSRVLQLLRKKRGFLRLRTGRLSLFIDLNDSEWDGQPESSPPLSMWRPQTGQLAAMRGSLLTLFIPLHPPQ